MHDRDERDLRAVVRRDRRPAVPAGWLPAWLPGVNRRTSFSVLYADDDLLVTLSDDDDLRVARRKAL